jgi:hypothetical protein
MSQPEREFDLKLFKKNGFIGEKDDAVYFAEKIEKLIKRSKRTKHQRRHKMKYHVFEEDFS